MRLLILLVMTFLAWPDPVFAYGQERGPVTFYVSNQGGSLGECTSEHPCRDIGQAVQFALPGDTILIREGDYMGFRLENIRATREKPLLIKGEGKVRVFPNKEMRDARDNIQISNCDWITLDNVQSFDAPRAGIRIDQSHHVTVRNSVFGNNEHWGIYANHSNDLLLEGNDCFGSKKQHGIYCANSGDRPVIRGNRVHDNVACGIHMNGDFGRGEGRDVVGDGVISGAVVENNLIFDNCKAGCAAINCDGLHDSVIRNNLMFNIHAAGITLFQEDAASGPSNVKVYNNTIDLADDAKWGIVVRKSVGPVTIMNNIVINRNGARGALRIGDMAFFYDTMERSATGEVNVDVEHVRSDYNVFSGHPGIVTFDDGVTRIVLRDWQKNQDRHSVYVDGERLFIDPLRGDYHLLSNSPAIDAGAVLPEVARDIDGKVRPQGHGVDAGAYEDF